MQLEGRLGGIHPSISPRKRKKIDAEDRTGKHCKIEKKGDGLKERTMGRNWKKQTFIHKTNVFAS